MTMLRLQIRIHPFKIAEEDDDKNKGIEEVEIKAESQHIQVHERHHPDGEHDDEQEYTPAFHVPYADQRYELQGDDDSQHHRHKIAHVFHRGHKQHREREQNQDNGNYTDHADGSGSCYLCHINWFVLPLRGLTGRRHKPG